jgi:hypothetical protein
MSAMPRRYVAKAEPGIGWRVWDRKGHWWGNYFHAYPQELLDELNGQKRTEKLVDLCRNSFVPRNTKGVR